MRKLRSMTVFDLGDLVVLRNNWRCTGCMQCADIAGDTDEAELQRLIFECPASCLHLFPADRPLGECLRKIPGDR